MEISIPVVAVFLAAAVVLVWWFGLRLSYAVVVFLAGVFVAETAAGPHIHNAVGSFAHWLSTL